MNLYPTVASKRRILAGSLFFFFLFFAGAGALTVNLSGCSALKSAQSAPVNQTITTVIADAGTAAITAEAMYNAGTIPQNTTTRAAINDLGMAYNDAKAAYLTVLQAEALYRAAVTAQLSACAPTTTTGSGTTTPAGACTDSTSKANAAKVAVDTNNANLSSKISVMVSKTNAVKTLTAGK